MTRQEHVVAFRIRIPRRLLVVQVSTNFHELVLPLYFQLPPFRKQVTVFSLSVMVDFTVTQLVCLFFPLLDVDIYKFWAHQCKWVKLNFALHCNHFHSFSLVLFFSQFKHFSHSFNVQPSMCFYQVCWLLFLYCTKRYKKSLVRAQQKRDEEIKVVILLCHCGMKFPSGNSWSVFAVESLRNNTGDYWGVGCLVSLSGL